VAVHEGKFSIHVRHAVLPKKVLSCQVVLPSGMMVGIVKKNRIKMWHEKPKLLCAKKKMDSSRYDTCLDD
jgi:hypothetical protein